MEPARKQLEAWCDIASDMCRGSSFPVIIEEITRIAYQAGADDAILRAARCPKPLSPRQQAMVALDALIGQELRGDNPHAETLARLLNSLPDD